MCPIHRAFVLRDEWDIRAKREPLFSPAPRKPSSRPDPEQREGEVERPRISLPSPIHRVPHPWLALGHGWDIRTKHEPLLLSVHIRPKHSVHPGQMALPVGLEPLHHIAIQAKMNRRLPTRHYHPSLAPELRAQRLRLRRVPTRLILTARPQPFNLRRRMSHDSRSLFHLCSLSVR